VLLDDLESVAVVVPEGAGPATTSTCIAQLPGLPGWEQTPARRLCGTNLNNPLASRLGRHRADHLASAGPQQLLLLADLRGRRSAQG